MRRKSNRRRTARVWRAGPDAGRSKLSKGRRPASRRPSRFSQLTPVRPAPALSPLAKIPTLVPWLCERGLCDEAHAHAV